jgi:hypothetical protein
MGAAVDYRFILPLLAALMAHPAPTRADDASSMQWKVIRVCAPAGGNRVAVAVPAEWREASSQGVESGSALRFVDESGRPSTFLPAPSRGRRRPSPSYGQ